VHLQERAPWALRLIPSDCRKHQTKITWEKTEIHASKEY
jgi:hypothetical protein